ncbi:hypothetical protein [Ekhidna sp.]|uniref:hypothetical protein n=1 Tax=Ekhidna sp. TaxID=2608089 RepID=UPI003515473C
MRYIIFWVALIAFEASGQSYTVIHVIGKIYDAQSGQYLTKGSKLASDANLKFETEDARAAVLSSSRGRFIVQHDATSNSQSDALYALSSVISPVRGRLSTRAGGINNALDFQKHFNDGAVALLGKQYEIEVSPSAFPMAESTFFYAQYQFNGETINKKLGSEENNLIIDLSTFFSVDGNPIDPSQVSDAKLYYHDASKGSSTFITDMNINYVDDETLKSIAEQFPDNTEYVYELINSMYGKCTSEQVDKALEDL